MKWHYTHGRRSISFTCGLCLGLALMFVFPFASQRGWSQERQALEGDQTIEQYFATLKRPESPNHWMVAPAGFPGRPDAVAPEFPVPVTSLRNAFRTMLRQVPGADIVAETEDGLHVVSTTRLFRFRDDVRVQFIGIDAQRSTLALYSASRAGYWDFGTNRRRIGDWLARTAQVLAAGPR
jgi:uncharacterized protein (DUF1499 family)